MAAAKKPTDNKPIPEEVLREFPPIGKYRVRIVKNGRRQDATPVLDIREYVSADGFEGFTRRGIRLDNRAQLDMLRDILRECLEERLIEGDIEH